MIADPAADPVALARVCFGLALADVTTRPPLRHVFTHIDRRVTPVLGDCLDEPMQDAGGYEAWRWVTPGELAELPLSEFMRKTLRAAS